MPRMSTEEKSRYQFTADNPNPRFRPAVSALMHKLREMKTFDDPLATRMIIDDMIYTHLVRRPHPDSLFYLLQQLHSYWGRMYFGLTPDDQEILKLEAAQKAIARDAAGEIVSLPLPGPEIEPPTGSGGLDLDDSKLKKRVRQVITEHYYAPLSHHTAVRVPACICGKEFEFIEEWANHARSVIWKELKDAQSG